MLKKISVRSTNKTQFIDITSQVQKIISEINIKSGICLVYVPHTTAGLTINENADPAVQKDILKTINKIIPFADNYSHLEGNSAAHIKASLVGFSQNLIIEDGSLVLGTWQGIYFCEFDGPRHRQVYVKIWEATNS